MKMEPTTAINKQRRPTSPAHDSEAQMIATQSRDWAQRVLRDEDLEIYTLRLLLEYARLLDDNRDVIGYAGDGSELDSFDKNHPMLQSLASFSWKEMKTNGDSDRLWEW